MSPCDIVFPKPSPQCSVPKCAETLKPGIWNGGEWRRKREIGEVDTPRR